MNCYKIKRIYYKIKGDPLETVYKLSKDLNYFVLSDLRCAGIKIPIVIFYLFNQWQKGNIAMFRDYYNGKSGKIVTFFKYTQMGSLIK